MKKVCLVTLTESILRNCSLKFQFTLEDMKLTAVKYYCLDLGNPPQRAFAIRTSMNRVIFFIYSKS